MAEREGLFGGAFARGEVETGSRAWLRAMLDTEAALAEAGATDVQFDAALDPARYLGAARGFTAAALAAHRVGFGSASDPPGGEPWTTRSGQRRA